jgi:signal peptidase I
MLRALRRVLGWLTTATVLAILAGWFVFLRPGSLGGPVDYVVIRGSSMLPAYETGDLVIVHAQDSYAAGDVVAYRVPAGEIGEGSLVIHRLVAAEGDHWLVQGDNNDAVDPWMPAGSDIVGTTWLHLPTVGRALAVVRQPAVLGALAAALVVMAMLWKRPGPPESPSPARRLTARNRLSRRSAIPPAR